MTRVNAIKDVVNDMCVAFIDGDYGDGAQYYQAMLADKVRSAGLLEDDVWLPVDNIGVHPDNREGYGLVPIDVHDLLDRIANDGWSFSAVDTMAVEVPPGELGDKWRAFNEQLAKEPLLPNIQTSFMTHVTARGSHTTSAVRCLKHPPKGVHAKLTGENGNIDPEKFSSTDHHCARPFRKACRTQSLSMSSSRPVHNL